VGYDAFISYSHESDAQLALAVQRGLTRFAKPWYRRRALEVFRDETGLSTSPDLWKSIEVTLDHARWFVLLASPTAAESQWVNREVEHWLRVHGPDSMLPVVTDGEWEWDPRAGDFADPSSAVPSTLRGVFGAEPRHLDLRWAQTDTDLDLRNPRFRDAIADLAAPMHGRPKDDLAGEDVRQHRRTVRVAWSAAATLTVLLVAALIAAGLAIQQRTRANAARRRADDAATVADGRRLAAQAVNGMHADLARSMLLAVEGHRLLDDTQTRGALLSVAQAAAPIHQLIHGEWDAAALAPDDNSVFTVSSAGVFRIDLDSGRRRRITDNHFGPVRTAEVSPDGRLLALAGRDVHLLDVNTGVEARAPLRTGVPDALVNGVRFAPDGSSLAVITYPVEAGVVWSLPSGRRLGSFLSNGSLELGGLDYSRDSRWLAVAGAPGAVYDARSLQPRYAPSLAAARVERNVAMFPDGARVAVARFDRVFVRLASTGTPTGVSMASATPVALVAVSPHGKVIAGASDDGTVSTWDAQSGLPLRSELLGATRPPLFLRFASENRLVLATNAEILVFDLSAQLGHPLPGAVNDPALGVAVSSNDRFVAASNLNGSVQVWDLVRHTTSRLPAQGTAPSVAFRPGSTELAVGGRDGRVTLRDVETGRSAHAPIVLTAPNPSVGLLPGLGVESVGFDGSGRILAATTGAGDAVIIDAASARVVRRLHLQAPTFLMPVAVSPDGRLVATAGPSGIVETTVTGGHRREAENGLSAVSIAYSPDGKRLAVGTLDGRVLLLDARSLRMTAPPLVSNHGAPYGLAFDPAGRLLAVSGATITIWDVASGEAVGTDLVASGRLLPIAFSHDGRTLVAGSENGGVLRFEISTTSLLRSLCRTAGRELTRDEWQRFLPRVRYRATCPA
jgi:WD40 repeat protein